MKAIDHSTLDTVAKPPSEAELRQLAQVYNDMKASFESTTIEEEEFGLWDESSRRMSNFGFPERSGLQCRTIYHQYVALPSPPTDVMQQVKCTLRLSLHLWEHIYRRDGFGSMARPDSWPS